jgi:carboxymethylenebutenolidase
MAVDLNTQNIEFGVQSYPCSGTHPGIVLVHDVWGLSGHTRDLTGRLAGEGFNVLGIDLYRDLSIRKVEDPGRWIQELCDPEIISDIEAGAQYLATHPASAGRKVGVIGFCMGGMYALLAGCGGKGIEASVAFYGLLSHEHGLLENEAGLDPRRKPREPIAAASDASCPLLAFFGDDDPYITVRDVGLLEASLSGSRQVSEVVRYPGAGHAFMNDTRPEAYRSEAAADAWSRMLKFLRTHIG